MIQVKCTYCVFMIQVKCTYCVCMIQVKCTYCVCMIQVKCTYCVFMIQVKCTYCVFMLKAQSSNESVFLSLCWTTAGLKEESEGRYIEPPPPTHTHTPPPSPPHPPSPLLALMAQYWGSSLESGIHVDRCSLFPVESYLWSKHWYSCGFCTTGTGWPGSVYCDCDIGLDQYTVTGTLAWISILWLGHWPGSVNCDWDIKRISILWLWH